MELVNGWPSAIPKVRRLKGANAAGVAYERKFAREARRQYGASAVSGQWLRFTDDAGLGLAQPDTYALLPERIILFECKLRETDLAWPQLHFYAQLLEALLRRPVTQIQVCKILTACRNPVRDFDEIASRGVFHWLPT